jgi:hypothetical protein
MKAVLTHALITRIVEAPVVAAAGKCWEPHTVSNPSVLTAATACSLISFLRDDELDEPNTSGGAASQFVA